MNQENEEQKPFTLPPSLQGLRIASANEIRDYEWRTTILEHLCGSQLPPGFHIDRKGWTCKPQEKTYRLVSSLITGNKTKGAIIVLAGPRGTGKTSIAAQIIIDRAWNEDLLPWHRRPPYRKAQKLVNKFKPLYSDFGSIDTESLNASLDSLCKDFHPLVIIDEVNECDDIRVQDRILTDLLDRRYSYMVDTILISNKTAKDFKATTNDSVLSRISETGRIIACEWASFRDAK